MKQLLATLQYFFVFLEILFLSAPNVYPTTKLQLLMRASIYEFLALRMSSALLTRVLYCYGYKAEPILAHPS